MGKDAIPTGGGWTAAGRAYRHVKVSGTVACSSPQFAEALRTGLADEATLEALRSFLEEGEEHTIVDIVAQGASSFEILRGYADRLLPQGHPTTLFLGGPPP